MQNSISNNLQQFKLEDVVEKFIDYRGKTPKKTLNGIPLITAKIIKNGIIGKPTEYIAPENYNSWMTRGLPKKGDVLLTTEAPLGEVASIKDEYVALAQRIILLRADNKFLTNSFLEYWLKSNIGQSKLKSRGSGSTVTGIKSAELKKIIIDLPSLKQQKDITTILTAFDDKIELNNKIAKTLQDMTQSIFKEWFINFQFPGYEKVEFIDSEFGRIPDKWTIEKFQEYARLEYGKALKEENRKSGKISVYGSSGQVGFHNESLCTGPGIVVGRKGNVGSVFWIDEDYYPIDTTFYINSRISLYYIYFLLKNMRFHTGDSAVPGLNRDSVHNQSILIPEKKILKWFDQLIKPIYGKLKIIKSENQKLTVLRDSFLSKLMKGEIQV